jgi:hypothetical protein
MTTRRTIGAVAAVAILAVALTLVWLRRDVVVAGGGDALEVGGGYRAGMRYVRNGDDVFYLASELVNLSDHGITILAITPNGLDPGLEFVDARVYKRADFPGGVVPVNWRGAPSDGGSPAHVRSEPVRGRKLAAGQSLDDVVLLHLRVTTVHRPLGATGVKVEYEEGRKRFTQVLDVTLDLIDDHASRAPTQTG